VLDRCLPAKSVDHTFEMGQTTADQNRVVLFTGDEVSGISRRMDGYGTAGCRSEEMADELHAEPSIFSPDFAAHFDISSAAMVLARGYFPVQRKENRYRWARDLKDSTASSDKMYEFLCSGLATGVKPKQEPALRVRAEMLCQLLGVPWRQQPTADKVLHFPAFAKPSE
jgi:hypothetical protein